MSARTKQMACMSTSGRPRRYQFYRTRADEFDKTETKYVVTCGDCREHLQDKELIITTYTKEGDNEHYHCDCYGDTENYINYEWPACSQHIDNYDLLTKGQKELIKSSLLIVKPTKKYQQFDKLPLKKFAQLSNDVMKQIFRDLDIQPYKQRNKFDAPKYDYKNAETILKQYLDNKQFKDKFELMVWGYINREKNYNVPVALYHLILQFTLYKLR